MDSHEPACMCLKSDTSWDPCPVLSRRGYLVSALNCERAFAGCRVADRIIGGCKRRVHSHFLGSERVVSLSEFSASLISLLLNHHDALERLVLDGPLLARYRLISPIQLMFLLFTVIKRHSSFSFSLHSLSFYPWWFRRWSWTQGPRRVCPSAQSSSDDF